MTCEELYGRLTDHSEGVLKGDVCAEVERHLAECAGCQQIRQDLEDLARLCRESAAPSTMPADVRSRIASLLLARRTATADFVRPSALRPPRQAVAASGTRHSRSAYASALSSKATHRLEDGDERIRAPPGPRPTRP